MHFIPLAFVILLSLAMVCLIISFVCYMMAFHVRRGKQPDEETIVLPKGRIYEPYKDLMTEWIVKLRALPCRRYSILSHDGLALHGRYFEFAPGAPIEIMFHGYRGGAEPDMAGGVDRAFRHGRSVLLVDQRCAGRSGGSTISFGINEHRDCLAWLDFARAEFGSEARFILTGISMGAATVLLTADKIQGEDVLGILADCGYSTAKDVIRKVITQMGLPAWFFYPFVKLGAMLFGRFDLEEDSALDSVKNAKVPVIFFHGEADAFVPCWMSRENYAACSSRKMLVTMAEAGHGLCYAVEPETYLKALCDFFGPEGSHPSVRQKLFPGEDRP